MHRRTLIRSLGAAGIALSLPGCALKPQANTLAVADFQTIVTGLDKAEGIAIADDGRLYLSNGKSAILVREVDGTLRPVGTPSGVNGVALDRQGRVILANFGLLTNSPGSLQRLDPATGALETLADAVDGRRLVASNFPVLARDGSIYCTHSTWSEPARIGTTIPAGFVYRVTPDGAVDLVAGGLRGANGCCLDRGEKYLYVALTAAGRIVRLPRRKDSSLGPAEDFGPVLGDVTPDAMFQDILKLDAAAQAKLGYPDGLAFDAVGNLWVTLPFANKLVMLTPTGKVVEMLHDPAGTLLNRPTNLAWGGPGRRDLHVVSRGTGSIIRVRTAVAGLALAHQAG
ncbi:SMP-30/gluconolactonase/LRE family protein [Niveispirillum irakense]|uniref:SMP-30/gluconolactonase/LRE family protein n=1 Tax=Niveispirillum irakense TaxID=34011 RepID=UPI0004155031|nr:SMP-30/gluconolactonase/LRE family protein [Niveispirillum irakense]